MGTGRITHLMYGDKGGKKSMKGLAAKADRLHTQHRDVIQHFLYPPGHWITQLLQVVPGQVTQSILMAVISLSTGAGALVLQVLLQVVPAILDGIQVRAIAGQSMTSKGLSAGSSWSSYSHGKECRLGGNAWPSGTQWRGGGVPPGLSRIFLHSSWCSLAGNRDPHDQQGRKSPKLSWNPDAWWSLPWTDCCSGWIRWASATGSALL